jgi:hypothetical protein
MNDINNRKSLSVVRDILQEWLRHAAMRLCHP